MQEKKQRAVTRTERPPENAIAEFVAFIDHLLKTMDPAVDDDDPPTEKMELLETQVAARARDPGVEPGRSTRRAARLGREMVVKRPASPPPLPPRDEEEEEIELFEDSLMPTQF